MPPDAKWRGHKNAVNTGVEPRYCQHGYIYTNVDLLYKNGEVISIRMQRSRCEMR